MGRLDSRYTRYRCECDTRGATVLSKTSVPARNHGPSHCAPPHLVEQNRDPSITSQEVTGTNLERFQLSPLPPVKTMRCDPHHHKSPEPNRPHRLLPTPAPPRHTAPHRIQQNTHYCADRSAITGSNDTAHRTLRDMSRRTAANLARKLPRQSRPALQPAACCFPLVAGSACESVAK